MPTSGLPATYEEAMIQEAMALIARIEDKLTALPREYIAAQLRERLRRGLTDRQRVIDAAWDGDDLSHDVLMAEFHEMLDEGIMPPASLRAYAAQTDKHPKRGKGRVWYTDWRRNHGFMILLALVGEKFNLNATRSRSTDSPCAASVLAIALQRRGFKRVSESRLTNLWGQLGEMAIESIALYREWPEIMPYIGMSGDPAALDLSEVRAALRPLLKSRA
jgi:hypothetical protein